MNDLQVKVDGDQIFLSGDISYETVVRALQVNLFSAKKPLDKPVCVDFSGIGHVDSSGLALMIHWLREAKKKNIAIQFVHIPKKLIALAGMSNLEEVLPIL